MDRFPVLGLAVWYAALFPVTAALGLAALALVIPWPRTIDVLCALWSWCADALQLGHVASGYRAYPAEVVDIVRFVKRAQELGFTLDEVQDLVHLADGGPQDCDAARALAKARMNELEHRIDDLQWMRDSLAELVAACDGPRVDRRCPLLHTLHTDRRES